MAVALVQPVSERLREAFVLCHAEGHQWRHEGRVGGSEPGARPPRGMTDAVARYSVCTSCTAERFRWYSRSGEVFPVYRYPDGYLHRKLTQDDDPAPTRQWWRQQVVISLFEDMVPVAKRRRGRAS
jgi:hypothetical protein